MAEKIYEGTRLKGKTWSYRFKATVYGRTVSKEKSGFRTSKEAYDARVLALKQFEVDNFIELNVCLDIVYQKFIEIECEMTKSYNTVKRYNSLYKNHIQERFGNCKIREISNLLLESFIAEKTRVYNSDYPRSIYNFLHVIFRFANKMGYVLENPMLKVSPPKQPGNRGVEVLTAEQIKAMQERLSSTNLQLPFNIGLALGLRASECYALRWSDIDLDNRVVRITRQLQKQNGVWCFADLKTKNAARTIKFGEGFATYLRSHKELQRQNKLRFKEFYATNKILDTQDRANAVIEIEDFVNVHENGKMLSADSNKVISRIAKTMGIDFNFHKLRHGYCSMLAEHSVNPTTIKENAGHGNCWFTFDRYIHSTDGQREQAAQIIDNEIEFSPILL